MSTEERDNAEIDARMSSNEIVEDQDQVAGEESIKEPEKGSLGNKEAIRKAIEVHKSKEVGALEVEKPQRKAEVEQEINPPAEFTNEEKEAWRAGDVKRVNQAYLRLTNERTREVTRLQSETNRLKQEAEREAGTYKQLASQVQNYFRLRGDDVPDEQKIIEALQLTNALKTDRGAAKAELAKLGFKFADEGEKNSLDEIKQTVQKEIAPVVDEIKRQKLEALGKQFDASYKTLMSQKNRTGDPVFPDLFDNSLKGQQFGRLIGSLTQDPEFQQRVLADFPDADHAILVREAYKYAGGRVVGESVKVSPEKTQSHIEKSRRAAASSPGRATFARDNNSLKGKLDRKAAIRQAIRDVREQ